MGIKSHYGFDFTVQLPAAGIILVLPAVNTPNTAGLEKKKKIVNRIEKSLV